MANDDGPGISLPPGHPIIFLTAEMGVGQRLTLDTINRRVAELPLHQSLLLLSEMSYRAERATVPRFLVDEQITLAAHIFPPSFMPNAERIVRDPYPPCAVLSSQAVVALGIRLLAFASAETPAMSAEVLARKLGALCLAIGDHLDPPELNNETTTLEFLRLGLFYGNASHTAWVALASQLLFDELPQLQGHREWMDPLTAFQDLAGISLPRFWAITYLQGLAAETPEHFMFPVNIAEHPISEVELKAWSRLLTSALPEAHQNALADLELPPGWSMGAVWRRPIIVNDDGRGPVLARRLLQMQSEPTNMFWAVRDVLVGGGRCTHQQWSNLFGAAVEQLGIHLLEEYIPPSNRLFEAELVTRWDIPARSKRADAAVYTSDGDLVVIDFVFRQFTRETTASGDVRSLMVDLERGVIEKLEQIDSTIDHAIAAGDGRKRIFPVVVLGSPYPANPLLDIMIDAALEMRQVQVLGRLPECRKWIAMDMVSFLLLLRSSQASGIPVPELLEKWQSSALARNTFREWAISDKLTTDLPGGGVPSEWWDRVQTILTNSDAVP